MFLSRLLPICIDKYLGGTKGCSQPGEDYPFSLRDLGIIPTGAYALLLKPIILRQQTQANPPAPPRPLTMHSFGGNTSTRIMEREREDKAKEIIIIKKRPERK